MKEVHLGVLVFVLIVVVGLVLVILGPALWPGKFTLPPGASRSVIE